MIEFEVCANGLASAASAQLGGATRIELCAGMPEGGTTPSAGEIATTRRHVQIPIHVIIRPRGGDFVYNDLELDAMCYDIRICKHLGVEGVVFGCLTPEGEYDDAANYRLIREAEGMRMTFHRAFDMCREPFETLDRLIEAGFQRVLTSGLANTALEGAEMLAQLHKYAHGRIGIMAGSGVNCDNVLALAKQTGLKQFHASLRKEEPSPMQFRREGLSMGGGGAIDEFARLETSVAEVRRMMDLLHTIEPS